MTPSYPSLTEAIIAGQAIADKVEGHSTLTIGELGHASWIVLGYAENVALPLSAAGEKATNKPAVLSDTQAVTLLRQFVDGGKGGKGKPMADVLQAIDWQAIALFVMKFLIPLLGG